MKVVLISPPQAMDDELTLVNSVLAKGLDYFHLRKPGYSSSQYEDYLKGIAPQFLKKVILYSHYELAGKYNIGGYHFPLDYLKDADTESFKQLLWETKKRRLRTGTSLHSLEEIGFADKLDYFFLSPVFDSISKKGYKANLNLEQVQEYLIKRSKSSPEALALGGINLGNLYQLKGRGFQGIALLGAIWENYDSGKLDERAKIFEDILAQVNEVLY